METLEGLVAYHNCRGVQDLISELSLSPYLSAARYLLEASDGFRILTGFPVAGMPETDGPPGAIVLADALVKLGKNVEVVSWKEAVDVFEAAAPRTYYRLLENFSSSNCEILPIITVEVCGSVSDGTYRNFRGEDISAFVPDFEGQFGKYAAVSIGDGGNEFGMGNASPHFFEKWKVIPPVSKCLFLIPAVTSNFGCYALVKGLECLTRFDLLPDPNLHIRMIENLVAKGCVDGMSGTQELKIDGEDLSVTFSVLSRIKSFDCQGLSQPR